MAKLPRLKSNSLLARVYILNFLFLLVSQLVLARLFLLQVKEHPVWLAKAASQYQNLETALPERGEIFLQNKDGTPQAAATNINFPFAYAVPKEIVKPEEASAIVSRILNLEPAAIFQKITKPNDPYEVLKKKISQQQVQDIKALKLKGIYISEERGRFYPGGRLAAHVIGFVGEDSAGTVAGRYGLEAGYQNVLGGIPAQFGGIRSMLGQIIFGSRKSVEKPGANLLLTIDPQIQYEAEKLLRQATDKWHARGGNIIVLEPKTGRVLAMANTPDFDLNEFAKEKDLGVFLNQAISARYEPGSVFKAFTMAAGLESGAVTPDTTYYDSGEVKFGSKVIRNAGNSAPKRQITMKQILERSYNVGAVFVAMKTGAEFMRDFLLNRFRFEEKSGIDLPGELISDFNNLKSPRADDINFATAAFGQGIAVTPIKLIQSFAVFANGGREMRPYIVEEIDYPDGRVERIAPKVVGQPVSRETIDKLLPMLEAVVESDNGSGKLGRVSGYRIAGKTGTGEIPYANSRGYSNRVNHTFIGFGPVSDPRAIVLVRLEEPIGRPYAESTAVPVFQELMKFILQYYAIPPDY